MSSNTMVKIPPGETIREQLDYQHISIEEAAKRMKMSEEEFNKLL